MVAVCIWQPPQARIKHLPGKFAIFDRSIHTRDNGLFCDREGNEFRASRLAYLIKLVSEMRYTAENDALMARAEKKWRML